MASWPHRSGSSGAASALAGVSVAAFISRLEQNRLPHAMMLTGATGIGVERIATALAQRLLCTAELSKYACGSCKGCQLMLAGNHPDLSILEPAEAGKAILIDQVRELWAS